MKTVAIIGGGITGLSLAEAIQRLCKDLKPIVLEAGDRPGGKIQTRQVDGFVVETGPHGFLDKEPSVSALIERLGLSEQLVLANEESNNRYVLRQSQLRKLPLKPPAFLFSDVLPLADRLRVIFEPWVGPASPGAEESVYDFAKRRLGEGVANVLVDAFVTGIYAGDPKRLCVKSAFPKLSAFEQEFGSLIRAQKRLKKTSSGPGNLYSFKNGLGTLTDAIAKRVDVRCTQSVKRLRKKGKVFTVETDSDSYQVDAVVLATPAFEAARLSRPLGKRFADCLDEIPYAPVSVVIHGFSREFVRRPLDGFGFLVPGCESRPVLGSIWASTVFADHAPDGSVMFRTLLGGRRHPEHAQGDDAQIAQRARLQLEEMCGLDPEAQPILQEVIRWDKGIPQYELGHVARVAAADEFEAAVPGLFFTGNAYRGIAMIQCIAEAEQTAEKLGKYLDRIT